MASIKGRPGTVLCAHTCWGMDHAEWIQLHSTASLPDGTVRHEGVRCDGRAIVLEEAVGSDLEPGWSNPCMCWDGAARHDGHCCFQEGTECRHHELMAACEEHLPIGDVPMYSLTVHE